MKDKKLLQCYTLDETMLEKVSTHERRHPVFSKDFTLLSQENSKAPMVLNLKSNPYLKGMRGICSKEERLGA